MKKVFLMIAVLAVSMSLFGAAVSEKASEVHVGTTALIEKAVQGEYAYDMLASGVSEIPLVRQDSTGSFHPLVAYYDTDDAKTWTFTVVDGLKWSDGVDVTAEDILFTLQYEDSAGAANLVSQTDVNGNVTEAKYESYAISEDGRSISLTLKSANVRELSSTSMQTVK